MAAIFYETCARERLLTYFRLETVRAKIVQSDKMDTYSLMVGFGLPPAGLHRLPANGQALVV